MIKKFNIGLKLWSSNLYYIDHALKLYNEKIFQYIELYVDPASEAQIEELWQRLPIPFYLHAPHAYSGLNFSRPEQEEANRSLIRKVDIFRQALRPQGIIFHPGIEGSPRETIRQIDCFKKEFPGLFSIAILENKPKIGLKGEVCVGASPEEMEVILKATGLFFCLDIGHAIYYANEASLGWENVLGRFLSLCPCVFHFADGDRSGKRDTHCHLGEGSFDLKRILERIPDGASVIIETGKDSKDNLDDFKKDVVSLWRLVGCV